MTVAKAPTKAAVSVREMAQMCGLSRSRFYSLIASGVFPPPVQHPTCKRPIYDRDAQAQCLLIRQTGVGAAGQLIVFNQKRRKTAQKARQRSQAGDGEHGELVAALKSLGLTTTQEAVAETVKQLYPVGAAMPEHGELVRSVFLHLHGST